MKKYLYLLLTIILVAGCRAERTEDVRTAIEQLKRDYPRSTIQDVYKSFYQAHFGAEHMIADTASVYAYLLYEVEVAAEDTVYNPYYEPVGANGAYVRVYLRGINEGLLAEGQLFDAFMRSAKPVEQPQQTWADEWQRIVQAAQDAGMSVSEEEKDLLTQAAQNDRAVHHSAAYREAYHPHYRIVRKDIFENEIKPLLHQSL